MKNIKQLPRTVHSLLRSSVVLSDLPRIVEELLSNSIDACSTKVFVSVSVEACCLRIEDDGCGITRDGLVLLGERHASSKIDRWTDVEVDLESVDSIGETLGSLSDISLVEIRTKARGKPNAYCKIIKGWKCLFLGIDGQREDVGTTVVARDLFYNQPVRRKYILSRPKKIMHSIKKCIFRTALVHPEISFRVKGIETEDELLCASSSSPLELVSESFGIEVSSSLHEIGYANETLKLSGYLSYPSHDFVKGVQYFYVNSRFICKGPVYNLINSQATLFMCSTTQKTSGIEGFQGKRKKTQAFASYILNLSCPPSSYGLTFEPSKTLVDFKDWNVVLDFVKQTIMQFWEGFLTQSVEEKSFPSQVREDDIEEKLNADSEILKCQIADEANYFSSVELPQPCTFSHQYSLDVCGMASQSLIGDDALAKPLAVGTREGIISNLQISSANILEEFTIDKQQCENTLTKWRKCNPRGTSEDRHWVNDDCQNDILDVSSGLLHFAGNSLIPECINKEDLKVAKVLLQLDKKFIPVVARGILVVLDQHAADERIRLEDLRQKVLSGEERNVTYLDYNKDLILPEECFQLLENYDEHIHKWGWIYKSHGQCSESFSKNMKLLKKQTYNVTLVAVPCILGTDLTDKDLLEFLKQLAETDGSSTLPPAVVRILNFKACRGAIMFGDSLLPSECALLFEELKKTSLCFQCAHGRPTAAPLVNMVVLHEQLSKLNAVSDDKEAWHGLFHHTPSIERARQRLASAERYQAG